MIIACVACSTRYVVPDGKIVGRKVRTVCKRCGAALMVDGTHSPPRIVAENAAQVERSREEYMVAFSVGQKERLSIKRIVELYAAGDISTSTHAWRDGMEKWLTLFEIDAIATELRAAGYLPVIGGARASDEDDDAMTRVGARTPVAVDDDDMTRVSKRPVNVVPSALEEDDATQVFRADDKRDLVAQALAMGEGNADSVTKVASVAAIPELPPEVPQARPPSVPPPRRISMPPVAVPVAEMLLEPTHTMSVSHTMLVKSKRRSPVLWAFVVLTLAAAVVLVVLYATGRWPLVTKAGFALGQSLALVASVGSAP
jgi:hypothetical protein